MDKKRDTVTYDLKQGNKVVYKGTTNDPDERQKQHEREGKKFSHLRVTSSRRMTEEGAKKQEAKQLAQYRKSHGGKNPKYNKDSDG